MKAKTLAVVAFAVCSSFAAVPTLGCPKGDSEGTHKKERTHAAAGQGGQQNRMKSCNEAAGRKDLHGDERRAFMSTCLKG